jgi:hypothetical protein
MLKVSAVQTWLIGSMVCCPQRLSRGDSKM